MSGGGLAADSSGNIFFATGNGTWNGTTDYGDSIVKLGPPSGGNFPVLDYFTPYNQTSLSGGDTDVASGGLVLLPALPSGQQLLAQMGKEGKIYLIDSNNMGKYCVNAVPACRGSDPNIVEEIPGATAGVWGTPAYWNGSMYWGAGSAGYPRQPEGIFLQCQRQWTDFDFRDVGKFKDIRFFRSFTIHFGQRQRERDSLGIR